MKIYIVGTNLFAVCVYAHLRKKNRIKIIELNKRDFFILPYKKGRFFDGFLIKYFHYMKFSETMLIFLTLWWNCLRKKIAVKLGLKSEKKRNDGLSFRYFVEDEFL